MKKMIDRERAETPYGKITIEQYFSLNPMAKELHDYWMNFKPEMYNELADNGTLWKLIQAEGGRLHEIVCSHIQSGLAVDQAVELARAEIYDEMAY